MHAAVLLTLALATDSYAISQENADILSPKREDHVPTRTVSVSRQFVVDGTLRKNVDFWVKIYTLYDTNQGVIHDSRYIDKIFEIMDFQTSGGYSSRKVREARRKWQQVLMSVHKKREKPESMSEEEKHAFLLYQDISEPGKYLSAAQRKRIRFQLGQKDKFMEGLVQSGKYLVHMEEIFRREGLPVELTRLPFVESSFNVRARSKVGASGIWQFMRSTGRLFLRINDSVDERNDPIRATEAAAKLLKINYESLKSWPLAITAYNHGRQGMMRAVRKVGSDDLEELIGEYRNRKFGFASSNFYTEFLAALEAERNADGFFGKIKRDEPLLAYEVEIPDSIQLDELCKFLSLDKNSIRQTNQGLSEAVFRGNKMVPAGYILRIPHDGTTTRESATKVFMAGYEKIPAMYKRKGFSGGKYGKGRRR